MLWCESVFIPDCVDRTINCTDAPMPSSANVTLLNVPDPINLKIFETDIMLKCPKPNYGFDYPVGKDFVSYAHSKIVNSINITCTKDR